MDMLLIQKKAHSIIAKKAATPLFYALYSRNETFVIPRLTRNLFLKPILQERLRGKPAMTENLSLLEHITLNLQKKIDQ